MCITSAQFLSLNLSFLFNLFYTLLLVSGHRDYYWIPRLLFFFGFKESATIIPSPLLLFFVIFGESATIIPSPLLFDTQEYVFWSPFKIFFSRFFFADPNFFLPPKSRRGG